MKIEFKIDDKNIELQQKDINTAKSIPLHDTEILRAEDLTVQKYYIMPHIFYYTNNLDFGNDYKEIEFFNNSRGHNILFMDKNITICEDITNMDNVRSFYNRFDIYNIAWEILDCDNSKKDEIIKYLTRNCYLEILPNGKLFKYPFTVLSNSLFVNTGSLIRIEAHETFYIKLKRSYSSPDSLSFKKLSNFLFNTVLRIYLHGNYWLKKR